MERLTNKREADAQREEYERRLANGYPRNIPEERFLRLAAYEDSGCEPEEVLPKDKADEIALKLMRIADLESFCSYDRLRELAEADKDGRCVVLPCKVGDTLYMIERIFDIDNGVCDEICARKVIGHGGNKLNKLWLIGSGGICNVSIFVSEFGKTVFFTREEAERALEEMEGKKDGKT